MVTDTPQPQGTKEWLVEQRLRVLTTRSRQDFVRDLVLGATGLPDQWLSEQQRAFLLLGPDELVTARTRKGGADLLNQVIYLGERLIPAIIEDYLERHTLDPNAQRRLRGRAPAVVRDLLFRSCPAWPSAESDGLLERLRPAIDDALANNRARRRTAGGATPPLIRENERPADQRDYDEKIVIYATGDPETLDRYVRLTWVHEKVRTVRIAVSLAAAGVVAGFYVALFLLLRHVEPGMSPRDATVVLASAVGTTLGSTGVGLLVTRANRSRPGGEDPPRPENR